GGTVTDTAMRPNRFTIVLTSAENDVNLTVQTCVVYNDQAATAAPTLFLHDALPILTQTATGIITGTGLQLLGSGTVNLDQAANNIVTLAANYSGPISYLDVNGLAVGTVTDTAMSPSTTTSGITSTGNDVKLTVQAGGLSIGQAVSTGAGDLTLNITGAVTQTATGIITGTGLQLLGSGTVNLDQAANNVVTLAASYSGPISYLDVNGLAVGAVTDTAMSPSTTTSGISSNNNDVKLTVEAGGPLLGALPISGAGDLTLNVAGAVNQTATGIITGTGLQLLGSGTVNLDQAANNVVTLAASYSGTISYLDVNTLSVGAVTDTAMSPSTTTSGITSGGNDVKLTVQAGGLSIAPTLATGAGDLTLNVVGPVSQTATGVITGTGLQLLGSGTVNLDQAANNIVTIAANYSGPISYLDLTLLAALPISDTAMSPSTTTSGITSGGNDVKLTVQAGGLSIAQA